MDLSFCQEFQNNIEILEDKNYSKFLYCIIRENKILLNSEPEEFIRQCMLYYLVYLSKIYPNLIDIKVEFNNADIVIFPVLPIDFKPYIPLLIVETKTHTNVNSDKKQLIGYLQEFRCSVGFLFDGNSLLFFNGTQDRWLRNLEEFKEIILNELEKVSYADNYAIFKLSQLGSLDAFKQLSVEYGYADIVFEYETLNGDLFKQSGKFFKFTGTQILYSISGNYTKNKQKIELGQFIRVISLRE